MVKARLKSRQLPAILFDYYAMVPKPVRSIFSSDSKCLVAKNYDFLKNAEKDSCLFGLFWSEDIFFKILEQNILANSKIILICLGDCFKDSSYESLIK